MSDRNVIEELEARAEHIDRWKLVLGLVLLIPPFSIIGIVVLAYLLYKAGDRLREAEAEGNAGDSGRDVEDDASDAGGEAERESERERS